MTIQFRGHVQKIEAGGADPTGVTVHVVTEVAVCGHDIVLSLPMSEAQHWLPGRMVQFTAYTLPASEPNEATGTTS